MSEVWQHLLPSSGPAAFSCSMMSMYTFDGLFSSQGCGKCTGASHARTVCQTSSGGIQAG